jgi:hypothetical protein
VRQATRGEADTHDALVDLLEAIEHFLKRLDIYTEVPQTPAMDELAVEIMVELLSTLAFATKELNQGRSSESVLPDKLFNSTRRRENRTRTFWRRQADQSRSTEAR